MSHAQVLLKDEQAFCLVLCTSFPPEMLEELVLPFTKSNFWAINNQLVQLMNQAQRINLALFSLPSSGQLPPYSDLVALVTCLITKAGSASFLLSNFQKITDPEVLSSLNSFVRTRLPAHPRPNSKPKPYSLPLSQSPPKRQKTALQASPEPTVPLPIFPIDAPPAVPAVEADEPRPQQSWRPTVYRGINFRSKLEAQTACFMHYAKIDSRYEKMKSVGPDDFVYTPDFWLPALNLFLEVKPCYPHIGEMAKCEALAANGFNVVLMYGRVGVPMAFEEHGSQVARHYRHAENFRGMAWSGTTGERLPGDYMWCWDEERNMAILAPVNSSKDQRWNHHNLLLAYEFVRNEAFGPQ